MQHDILALAKKFISIQSDPDNTAALKKILDAALVPLKGFTIEHFTTHGVRSALVYNTRTRPKKFSVILNAHLDVIPGKASQYKPRVQGNNLYGVGSMDMKANAACLILAFKEVAHTVDYPIALQLVTDEEVGGFYGTKYQIEKGVRTDFILAGEPTNFDIVNRAKGVLWLRITAKGESAHGAYPWRGDNAVWSMHEFLAALKSKYPIPKKQEWVTTVNLSTMSTTNTAFNKIPDDCVVGLDIRYIPEDAKTVLRTIRALLPKALKLEVLANEPSVATSPKDKHIALLERIGAKVTKKKIILRGAQGSSDARHYKRVGSAGIEFGPIGAGIGSDDEWVDIPSLEKYHRIIKEFLLAVQS